MALDMVPVASVQNRYNLSERAPRRRWCRPASGRVGIHTLVPAGHREAGEARWTLEEVAERHDATPSQVALAWLLGHSPACCPSQVPPRSRTWRRTWLQRRWSSRTRRWRCWREADWIGTMDAGIVGSGNIGATAFPSSRVFRLSKAAW